MIRASGVTATAQRNINNIPDLMRAISVKESVEDAFFLSSG